MPQAHRSQHLLEQGTAETHGCPEEAGPDACQVGKHVLRLGNLAGESCGPKTGKPREVALAVVFKGVSPGDDLAHEPGAGTCPLTDTKKARVRAVGGKNLERGRGQ